MLSRLNVERPVRRRLADLDPEQRAEVEESSRILRRARAAAMQALRTLYTGPEEMLVAAKISVTGTDTGDGIAAAIDNAEERIRADRLLHPDQPPVDIVETELAQLMMRDLINAGLSQGCNCHNAASSIANLGLLLRQPAYGSAAQVDASVERLLVEHYGSGDPRCEDPGG